MTDPRPRPTRRQFVCPDPLWARVVQQAREERTNASQWVREAIERRLEKADDDARVRDAVGAPTR